MSYISLNYYLLVAVIFAAYYLLPMRVRWCALLAGSAAFFYLADAPGIPALCWMIVTSFFAARFMRKQKGYFIASLAVSVLPFWIHLLRQVVSFDVPRFFIPMGLSYLSLQVIGYLADVYKGKTAAETNLAQYALFVSFFPQVVQGPIPRFSKLAPQLAEGHRFNEENVQRGFLKIFCGLLLKFLIADRAGIPAAAFYAETGVYNGVYAWLGMSMFMVQLYADFLGCVLLSMGVALLFGIKLENNFNHPYSSKSTAEIWSRWHMSLSQWLRDYIYFPLGGSRKGRLRKYLNLCAVFVVSAIWHGISLTYLAWGLLTAGYQIVGELTFDLREKLYALLHVPGWLKNRIRNLVTIFLFVMSSILFRSYGFRAVLANLASLVRASSMPEETGLLGLSVAEWVLLAIAFLCFGIVQKLNEKRDLEGELLQKPWGFRYAVYVVLMLVVLIFGTYGFGFDAGAFIYGGF